MCAHSILDSEAEDKRGFLLEWTEDGYYSAAVQVDGGDSGGDETRGGNENNDKEGDNDEGQGEDADDEAAGAGNKKAGEEAVPPKSIVQDGARLMMAMGAPPLWYGLKIFVIPTVDSVNPATYLVAFDDGDIKRFSFADLEANVGMKLLMEAKAEDGGIVANEKGLPQAQQVTWYRQARGDKIPIGVLLGAAADAEMLAGETVWTAHIADAEVVQKLSSGGAGRSRAKTNSLQDRLAFYTFRRGDCVRHMSGEENDPSLNLCVFGVVYKEREGVSASDQGRKMLVLYDIDAEVFFLGKWTDFRRIARGRGGLRCQQQRFDRSYHHQYSESHGESVRFEYRAAIREVVELRRQARRNLHTAFCKAFQECSKEGGGCSGEGSG